MLDDELLDDADALAEADSHDTLRALASAGAQVRQTLEAFAPPDRLVADGKPRNVLVAGLGGSAVVAEVLDALAGRASSVPVTSRRGGALPGWIGPLDLVIAVSMSGRAPEPLALTAEAGRRGARILAVSNPDSPLAELVNSHHGTLWPIRQQDTPVQVGARTRTGMWSLLTPVLLAADAIGLVDVPQGTLAEAADRLDEEAEACRPSSPAFVNPAKSLAVELDGTVPVVLADGDLAQAAAARATSMLARTARVPSVRGALPDDASDVVALFDGPMSGRTRDVFADPFLDGPQPARLRLLVLTDQQPHPDRPLPSDPVRDIANEAGVGVSAVVAGDGSPIARLAQLVARCDFTTTYLALGSRVDPGRSPSLADLRDRWRDGG